MAGDAQIRDFVCTACGCTCDDLTLSVEAERIVEISPPCWLAQDFFLAEEVGASIVAHIDVVDAVQRAAELLRPARAPLVMGFERSTVDAQRAAVEIAERVGASIDPTDERGGSRSHAAVQTVGAVTATLGEVATRSDLVVYWDCDPATHPRHRERFASREGQSCLVVNSALGSHGNHDGERLAIPESSSFECLWTLRALVRGVELEPVHVAERTGHPLSVWQDLARRLMEAHYATIFYDTASQRLRDTVWNHRSHDASTQAITELVQDLHRHTRAVAIPLGAPPNAVGAQQVLTWQTGFPCAVSFAREYPQYLPGEAVAVWLLERREVDAALIIASDPLPHLSEQAAAHLHSIPTIVLDDRETATLAAATVGILTAKFGIHVAGSVYRSDGVALPLRAALPSPHPDAADILARLAAALAI